MERDQRDWDYLADVKGGAAEGTDSALFLIKQARKMNNVQRCAGVSMIKHPVLSEHCFHTGIMFMMLAPQCGVAYTLKDLEFVFLHDILETVTGDLLYPAKHCGNNNDLMDEIEGNVIEKMCPLLAPYADNALKGDALLLWRDCDMLEFLATCIEDAKLGNTGLQKELALSTAMLSATKFDAVKKAMYGLRN